MITPMATVTCECCKESPAAFALTMRAKPPAADGWRRALCRECLEWLSDTVGQIRGDGATGLLATPSGNGRALGLGELKFSGQVLPTMKKLVYGLELKRVMRGKLVLGIADGWVSADGTVIYKATDLKVGLFRDAAPSGAA